MASSTSRPLDQILAQPHCIVADLKISHIFVRGHSDGSAMGLQLTVKVLCQEPIEVGVLAR